MILPIDGLIVVCMIKLHPGHFARVLWTSSREFRCKMVADVTDAVYIYVQDFMGIEAQAPPDAPLESGTFPNVIMQAFIKTVAMKSYVAQGVGEIVRLIWDSATVL